MVKVDNKTIHFGQDISTTYVEGGGEEKRKNYLLRHRVNEDWTKINAGSLSRWILWGDSTSVKKNLRDYIKRYGIEDNRKKY